MSIPSARTYAWTLAALRIYAGLFWISRALPKFTDSSGFLPPAGSMSTAVTRAIAVTGGPLHGFIVGTVQTHIDVFAQLVRFGEMAAGLLLLLGVLTRVGGLLGVVLGIGAFLSQGYMILSGWSSLEAAAIALSAVSLLLPTGRVLGIDALLKRSQYDEDVQEMPIPPARPEPQPQPAAGTIETTRGEIPPTPSPAMAMPPIPEPGPNGANGGPAFAPPASAGPQVDQGTRQSV